MSDENADGTALVVENYSDLAMMIAATLMQRNYRCEAVRDPEAAIGRLKDRSYSSILLDLTWPPSTNPVISFLREERPSELGKVIVMTGFDPSYLGLTELQDVCTFLRKPFGIDDLLERLVHCRDLSK